MVKWQKNVNKTAAVGHQYAKRPFAWVPTHVGDWTVWLERYEVVYRVVEVFPGSVRVKEIDRHILN